MTTSDLKRPPEIRSRNEGKQRGFWRSRAGLAAAGFLLIGALLLLYEHRLHVLGYLPFLIVLLCPLLHVFMHRGHGHGGHGASKNHAGDSSEGN